VSRRSATAGPERPTCHPDTGVQPASFRS